MDLLGGVSENGCIYNAITNKIGIRGWFYPSNQYDEIQVWYNNFLIGQCSINISSPDVYKNFRRNEAKNCRFSYETELDIDYEDLNFLLVVRNKKKIIISKIIEAKVVRYKDLIEDKAFLFHLKRWSLPSGGGIEQDNWFELCSQMMKEGKKFWDDFRTIWSEYFIQKGMFRLDFLLPEIVTEDNLEYYFEVIKNRYKVIILYGNCQIYKIGELLACVEKVRKEYLVIRTPAVCAITEEWKKSLRKIFSYADVFIYQKIKEDNNWGIWAGTDYILTSLSAQCKKICIPVTYFTGYFPGYHKAFASEQVMPYRDRFIDERIKWTSIDILKNGCSLSQEEIFDNAEDSLKELRTREQDTDIKISDYIENRWRKEQLFYTVNHLSILLYEEICKRILNLLGIIEINYIDDILEQDGTSQLIWPCVESILEFKQEYLFFNKTYDSNICDKQKWIEKYLELYR